MRNLHYSLHSPLLLCAVFFTFFISNFYLSSSAFAQCNPAANDPTFNPLDGGFHIVLKDVAKSIHTLDDKVLLVGGINGKRALRINQDGLIDPSFNFEFPYSNFPANGYIQSVIEQTDGKFIVVVQATITSSSTYVSYIKRHNANGSIDTSFNSFLVYQERISYVNIQSDGKILVAGYLVVDNVPKNLVRLNADGSRDTSFTEGVTTGTSTPLIRKIVVKNDNKIILVGLFEVYNGVSKNSIVRLNEDGSIDNSFNLNNIGVQANRTVYDIGLQQDEKIVISGNFATYNGTTVKKVIRLNLDGQLDNSLNVGTLFDGSDPISFDIQPDGKLLVGVILPFGTLSGTLVRLHSNGIHDTSFELNRYAEIRSYNNWQNFLVLPNGKILTSCLNNRLERINTDGTLDVSFDATYGFNDKVTQLVELDNGQKMVVGEFNRYNNISTKSIIKLNADNTINNSFNLDDGLIYPTIKKILVQEDGKIIASVRHYGQERLMRINIDGTLDSSFDDTSLYYYMQNHRYYDVNKIAIQEDGKVLISLTRDSNGSSNTYTSSVLLRLNSDGSIDTAFDSNFVLHYYSGNSVNGTYAVNGISILPNGKIIIAGQFSFYNTTTQSYEYNIARLLPDGTIDEMFVSDLDSYYTNTYFISNLVSKDNGDLIVVTKGFSWQSNPILRKMNEAGTVDATFETSLSERAVINTILPQENEKLIIAGDFSEVNGITRNNLAHLNSDGTLDDNFDNQGTNNTISTVISQPNNSLLMVGDFTSYNGIGRNRIAKLNNISTPVAVNTILPQNQYTLCPNHTTVLQARGQGTVYWYDSRTSIIPIHTGDSFTIPILTADSTYFYALDSVVGCGSSSRLEILVTTSRTLSAVSKTNYTAYLDNNGQIEVDAISLDSISVAACGNTIDSYLFDDTGLATRSFSCADTNIVQNVVLRVADNNGDTETSATRIHVRDTIRPVATIRSLPVLFNASNQATISVRDFITSLSDNCTDSVNINVVFNDTGLETKSFDCGNAIGTNLELRITDQSGNTVIQPVIIIPSATNFDFNVNIIANTFRPAIASNINVFVNNYSCAPKSGELKVTLSNDVTYISSSITPNRIVGNDLFWDVTDLSFDRNFVTRIRVTPDISLNIGDEVCFTGHITPEVNDLNRLNNLKQYCFPVVNSYDPNDKQVYPQGICDDKFTKRSDLPLTYTIRFQNTGNAPALRVRIADSLSNKLNRRSLRVVGTSHPMVVDTTANNNVINFVFDNINLPDSTTSPELSQGYVIFELSEIANHTDTSRISNRSFIYFDTNAPIITNTVKNTIVNTLPLCTPPNPNPTVATCTLPTNLRTEIISSTRVKLLWTTPANTNAVTYEVLRNGQRLATIPASNLSYLDSTLIANTQYNYSIKAICGNSVATSGLVQVRTLPSTPILLSVVAACRGERGRINVQSAGATYRVYSSNTSTAPLFETNNASIETPVLTDSTTFYISVVINGQESKRLRAVVPIKEVFSATIEQGTLLESCATEFTLSAQNVEGATYTWFRENIQVGTERTLNTTFEARYKVRVIKNGCSSESAFTTTRFVDAPTARIQQGNSVSFCGNGTLNAQDTSANVTYTWILNGTNVGNGTSLSVSESGTYTLKASQPSCADSVNVVVTITTAPTNVSLTADKTAICENAQSVLSATTGTGFTYKWFRNDVVISNTSASLSTSEIGSYKVEITTPEGCRVTTSEVEITQSQAATSTITVNKVEGKDKTITVASQDSIVSVIWFKDGNEVSALNNQRTITPTETGNYKAKVVYASGCEFETAEKTFTFEVFTGIEEESATVFNIYPNPNTGSFKVEFAETTNQKTRLTLVDGLGRMIYSKEISMNEKTLSINLPKISAGVYVVQIVSEGKVYTKQLIIQ